MISWRSKQQTLVAQSSVEGNFIALAYSILETLWPMKFGKFLKLALLDKDFHNSFSLCIVEDNYACISDARSGSLTELSKHVDVKCQFMVDHVNETWYSVKRACSN